MPGDPGSTDSSVDVAAQQVRILIVDDHLMVAESLRLFLAREEDLEVLGIASSGKEALNMIGELEPELILLDVRIPDIDGLEVLRRVRRRWPAINVLIITSLRDPRYLWEAINSGAAGFLSKDTSLFMIPQAIRSVMSGSAIVDRSLLSDVIKRSPSLAPSPATADDLFGGVELTEQESKVLSLIARGMTNNQIAKQLSISRNTVKTHVGRIYEKIRVSDRTQAAIWAVKHGLAE